MSIQSGHKVPTVAFMLAEQYSGATMFAILLDHHRELSCDGETFPTHVGRSVACSCGDGNQNECEYYRQVCSHMLRADGASWDLSLFRREPRYSRVPAIHRQAVRFSYHPAVNRARDLAVSMNPTWRMAEGRFVDAHLEYMQKSLAFKGAKIFVDGTKSYRRAALLAASGRVNLNILYLVRDGRGFARSYARVRDLPATALPAAAGVWSRGLRRFDAFTKRFPEVPVRWVRYEDICRDFDRTIEGIFDFVGVGHDPEITARIGRHHVLGNNIRFTFDGSIRESLGWKEQMAPADYAHLTELLRPQLERFGYE